MYGPSRTLQRSHHSLSQPVKRRRGVSMLGERKVAHFRPVSRWPLSCPCSKSPQDPERLAIFASWPYRHGHGDDSLCRFIDLGFSFSQPRRARHQLTVLRRQRPGRSQLSSLDRLLWVRLYRIWPQVIDAMILVKPATVVAWHRQGFRFNWRWR